MKVEDPEHSGLPPPSQVAEVSGLPGPVATTVPPQVLPDSSEVVGVVHGEVPPVGVPPVGVLPGVTEFVDIVPGEVPLVGGLPDSMQVGVNSGEAPPATMFRVHSKLGRVTVKYPQLVAYQSVERQNVWPPVRGTLDESPSFHRGQVGGALPCYLCLPPRVTFIDESVI